MAELVVLSRLARSKRGQAGVGEARTVADAVNFARDLINPPPNDLYPESFAAELTSRAKRSKVKVAVSDEKALAKRAGTEASSVSGRGRPGPPRLVTMTYKPSQPVAHIALVGKGITFDSGGLSIKPTQRDGDDEVRHVRRGGRRPRRHSPSPSSGCRSG